MPDLQNHRKIKRKIKLIDLLGLNYYDVFLYLFIYG